MASGNAEARISDGRTCSATKNEIGSINAACASTPLTVVDDEGSRGAKGAKRLGGKVCLHARARARERNAEGKRERETIQSRRSKRARRRDNKPTPAPRGVSVVIIV